MKRTLLVGAALALAVSACGQAEDPDEGAPTGDGSPREDGSGGGPGEGEEVHVLNLYGNEEGFDDQRPKEYVATGFTTFSDMEWDEWDTTLARGEGEVLGTWCMDQGCQDDPYDVEVELGDPVEADGTWYFSTYEVTDYEDMPEEQRDALYEADDGRLDVPATAE